MDPDNITLDDLTKSFEYFKISAEIDNVECLDTLKNIAKSYVKLYFKQQEVVKDLIKINP